jgi:hypothetical protein
MHSNRPRRPDWPHSREATLAMLCSCPVCGCLMLAYRFADGGIMLWDPSPGDRQLIAEVVGARTWAALTSYGDWRQHWGLVLADHHECPPYEVPPARSPGISIREAWAWN